MHAIDANDTIRYKQELVIAEMVINGFNCIYLRKRKFKSELDKSCGETDRSKMFWFNDIT
jgi:hypothetical protein